MPGLLSQEVKAEPNLTPMLDMVFQLVTFFMLVINFKAAELDASLHLPVVGSARPVQFKGQDLLVLNVSRRGALRVRGEDVADAAKFIANEAMMSLFAARRHNPELKEGDELPSVVLIRADRQTPFRHLYAVIVGCQQHGFRNFSLRALNRKASP